MCWKCANSDDSQISEEVLLFHVWLSHDCDQRDLEVSSVLQAPQAGRCPDALVEQCTVCDQCNDNVDKIVSKAKQRLQTQRLPTMDAMGDWWCREVEVVVTGGA